MSDSHYLIKYGCSIMLPEPSLYGNVITGYGPATYSIEYL